MLDKKWKCDKIRVLTRESTRAQPLMQAKNSPQVRTLTDR
jgi:hypothetical protein